MPNQYRISFGRRSIYLGRRSPYGLLILTLLTLASLVAAPLYNLLVFDSTPRVVPQADNAIAALGGDFSLDKIGLLLAINEERATRNLGPLNRASELEYAAGQAAQAIAHSQDPLLDEEAERKHLFDTGYQPQAWRSWNTYGHMSNASVLEWLKEVQGSDGFLYGDEFSEIGIAIENAFIYGERTNLVVFYSASPKPVTELTQLQPEPGQSPVTTPAPVSQPSLGANPACNALALGCNLAPVTNGLLNSPPIEPTTDLIDALL